MLGGHDDPVGTIADDLGPSAGGTGNKGRTRCAARKRDDVRRGGSHSQSLDRLDDDPTPDPRGGGRECDHTGRAGLVVDQQVLRVGDREVRSLRHRRVAGNPQSLQGSLTTVDDHVILQRRR